MIRKFSNIGLCVSFVLLQACNSNLPSDIDQTQSEPGQAKYPHFSEEDFKMKEDIDLDGDGSIDHLEIKLHDEEKMNFVLTVNNASVTSKLNGAIDGFVVVDIDEGDLFKEVAVHTSGPSNDDEYLLYQFDGKILNEIGYISRWPFFPGDGSVVVDSWMGFWTRRDVYHLNPSKHVLELQQQDIYSIPSIKAEAIESFILRSERKDNAKIVATVNPVSNISFLGADPSPASCAQITEDNGGDYLCDWYRIGTGNGEIGWARLVDFSDKVQGLPLAD